MNCTPHVVPITSITGHASWSLIWEGLHDAHYDISFSYDHSQEYYPTLSLD